VNVIQMVIPKGSIFIFESVINLLDDSGIKVSTNERAYIPYVNDPELCIKIMRPQDIPRLIDMGSHDVGFTGLDWIVETEADVEEILDLCLDPVKLVVAVPESYQPGNFRNKKLVVASEYEAISENYLKSRKLDYVLLRTAGATEVFPQMMPI